MSNPADLARDLRDKSPEGRWLICRPCPVGGAALVRVGHSDRCPACGRLLRDPEPGELARWADL